MTERLVLRGARIADGSGGPMLDGDVVVEDGVIRSVGVPGPSEGAEVVELGGLVLAPGFIDIHTHYDAQLFWDRDLSPSTWHGVTSVVMGNCGFGIAPTRPGGRHVISKTLENVEGMSAEVLAAGLPWNFESYPQYLDAIEAEPLRCNVASLVGHTPLRLSVMGMDAYDRTATPDEVADMVHLVREAVEAGALGFASSRQAAHVGIDGRPVPSRLAGREELEALLGAVAAQVKLHQFQVGAGMEAEDIVRLSLDQGFRLSWTAIQTGLAPTGAAIAEVDRLDELGAESWPQTACMPVVMQVSLRDPYPFASLPTFSPVMSAEADDRKVVYEAMLEDPALIDELNLAWKDRWRRAFLQETTAYAQYRGRSLEDLAVELHSTPAELLLRISIADDLATRVTVVAANDDEAECATFLTDDRIVLGLSDAGAHSDQMCDAAFTTHLLGHWVRDKRVLSLEKAIWRLTRQPAEVFGLEGRGRIEPGYVADLVAFDPATVDKGQLERIWDLPADGDRLIRRPAGIHHMWVSGRPTRRDGIDIEGARYGRLLRGGSR